MGQIFHACVYDIETKTCFVDDADKFHANCYSHSGIVAEVHYLLRQKPYRVMWCGGYAVYGVFGSEALEDFERDEDLLGVSTYCNYEDFEEDLLEEDDNDDNEDDDNEEDEDDDDDLPKKSFCDKVKIIDENHKLWKHMEVWDEAKEYFDWEETLSVKYSGYLVNHTQKLAVDLADYFRQSCYMSRDGKWVISVDAVPVLTETGGGMPMLLDDGQSVDTTDDLSMTWCGDLLQIVENLPEDYMIINCCFAEIWKRAEFCYYAFGLDEKGYVLKNASGQRFEATKIDFRDRRVPPHYVRIEDLGDQIEFIPERVEDEQSSSCT